MKENFNRAFELLLSFEGYLSHDKYGGNTIFGIAEKYYPETVAKLRAAKDKVEQITIAKNFYKQEFWDKLKCDDYVFPVDIVLFDTAVNLGKPRALKFLCDYTTKHKEIDKSAAVYILLRRALHYARVCNEDKNKRQYLLGWLNRIAKLYELFENET